MLNLLTCADSSANTKLTKTQCHMLGVTRQVSFVTCYVSPVTCHVSLTPTATDTDPLSVNSSSMHSRMVLLILT